jgi:hypothetical protein
LSGWLACLRDFSPFAFACPVLEKQYQEYQSAHVVSHMGTMCWLLCFMWAAGITFTWHKCVDFPHAPLLLALCVVIAFFRYCAPVMFRRHWHLCSFIITVAHLLMYDTMHTTALALRMQSASGRLHDGTLLELELPRILTSFLFAMGLPLSLPPWLAAQMLMFATQNFTLAGKCESIEGLQRVFVPWPVSSALYSLTVAYSGVNDRLPESARCRVGMVFWRVQMEGTGAVFGVLRDIAWRRSFLTSHPHLIGQDGVARAAAWPLESPRTLMTCMSLVLSLVVLNIMAIDFWVSAVVHSGCW